MIRINTGYKKLLSLPDSYDKFICLENKMLSIKYHTTDPEINKEYRRLYAIYNPERMQRYDRILK